MKTKIDSVLINTGGLIGLDLNYFVKSGFWVSLNFVFSFIAGIILSYLFAKYLTTDSFGKYSFITSLVGVLSLTTLPGMGQAILQAAVENNDGVFKQGLRIVFKWSLLGTLALIIISFFFFFRGDFPLFSTLLVVAVIFPFYSVSSLYTSFLTGKKKFKNLTFYAISTQMVLLVLITLTIWKFPNLLVITLISFYCVTLLNLLFTYFSFKETRNNRTDPKTLSLGLHLSFSQIFTVGADYFDRFLIPILLGFSNNAIYGVAILLPLQIHNLLKVYLNLAQPKIAALKKSETKKVLWPKTLQLSLIFTILIFTYILISPFLFSILYPNYQQTALLPSQLFSLSLLYFPTYLLALSLVKQHQTKALYKINISYALVSLISLIIFIPIWGIIGAVGAKIISRLVYAGLIIFYFNESLKE